MAAACVPSSRRAFAGRSVVGIIIALVVGGYLAFSRTENRDELSSDLYAQMMQIVIDAPEHAGRPREYVPVLESAHRKAFSDAFTLGGRRTGSKFDRKAYLEDVFSALIRHAGANGFEEDKAYFEATLAVNLAQ